LYTLSVTHKLHYIGAPDGLLGILVKETGQPDKFYYTYTDYLGSITEITDGTVVEEISYDAWGRRRNPTDWSYSVPINQPWTGLFARGYTGHSLSREERCGKHLDQFGLINMNGRVYSLSREERNGNPVLSLMLSPDNYVSDATSTVAFNRYLYANGNPMKYTDPSGENPFLIAAAVYLIFFTETGYDLQKFVSPVALHVDVNLGTHKRGIGIDASVGVPQTFWVSARVHGGVSYNWKNYDVPAGWETRYGAEVGLTPGQ